MQDTLRNEFIERRAQDRRAKSNAAIAHHFAQCRRAQAERRKGDSAFINQWVSRFHAARK